MTRKDLGPHISLTKLKTSGKERSEGSTVVISGDGQGTVTAVGHVVWGEPLGWFAEFHVLKWNVIQKVSALQ